MSDFREVARRGLGPLVGSVPEGPTWTQVTAPQASNISPRTRPARGLTIGLVVAMLSILTVFVLTSAEPPPSTTPPLIVAPSTTSTLPLSTTTTVDGSATACGRGLLTVENADQVFDFTVRLYNNRRTEDLVNLIGDGSVYDPTLEPESSGFYDSVSAWVEAARVAEDTLSPRVYAAGEPLYLTVSRSNPALQDAGIDDLWTTLQIWMNPNCELRVEATEQLVSSPDPCRFHEVFRPDDVPPECLGPFGSRARHVSVWTGEEAIFYGGGTGTAALTTGLAFNPATQVWREIAPSPVAVDMWWREVALWTGEEMVIAGRPDGDHGTVQLYSPENDSWRVASPRPTDDRAIGAMVWTGTEVLFVGGDNLFASNGAWGYNPATDSWRELPDPGIPNVEGIEGVWTGTEAIFTGGYSFMEQAGTIAYNPATDSWRRLPDFDRQGAFMQQLAWTGQQVIVYSGHWGPRHLDHLPLFDPVTNEWTQSSPMPINPRERLASAWTGERLIIWGGYATYGETPDHDGDHMYGDGAMYDPATDTWTLLPVAPLSDRCDHSGTWTGEEFIVLGGSFHCGSGHGASDSHAAAYHPGRNEWTLLTRN